MKRRLSIIATVVLLGSSLHAETASNERENQLSIYGVNAQNDRFGENKNGTGVFYNTEALKVMMEGTSELFKLGTVLKINPIDDKWYFKMGLNYIDQRLYAPDRTNEKVKQYSAGLGAGYMLEDDLYLEIGGSSTKLNGETIGTVYAIDDEKTNRMYAEIAKRFDTDIGTIDTTFNAGRLHREFGGHHNIYGGGVDYYPISNLKLGFYHSHSDRETANTYSLGYGYFTASYNDNISQRTQYASVGVQFAFSDITDISSYRMPTNLKPHLSELHAFEQMTFGPNMNIQSTNGVHRTAPQGDNATMSTPPIIDAYTSTSINSTPGAFTDADGVRNVRVELYSDPELTTRIASAPSGDFIGLNPTTRYYLTTVGEAFNTQTQTWETKRSTISVITLPAYAPGESVISLAEVGNLIAPVRVNGNWYYFWDISGDGVSDAADVINHIQLNSIFSQDITGVVNTTEQNSDGGYGTSNTYRYATINGVNVVLPTSGTGNNIETGSYPLVDNQSSYTDYAAVWDAHNHPLGDPEFQYDAPPGWISDTYWSATVGTDCYTIVNLYAGAVNAQFGDSNYNLYVMLQVLPSYSHIP